MITYSEYIAFLEDAECIRGELAALPPDQQLQRLNAILQQSPKPYRLVMERIVIESYYPEMSLARRVETVQGLRALDRKNAEPPKDFLELLWRLLKARRWGWASLLAVGVLLIWFWSTLPDEMKMRILDRLLGWCL